MEWFCYSISLIWNFIAMVLLQNWSPNLAARNLRQERCLPTAGGAVVKLTHQSRQTCAVRPNLHSQPAHEPGANSIE